MKILMIKQTYLIMPVVFLGKGYGENEKNKTRHSQENNGDDKWELLALELHTDPML